MKAIIHIGTPRTGTTSIQDFLGKNREVLKKQGIFIPTSSAGWCTGNQVDLAAVACDPTKWAGGACWFTTMLPAGYTTTDQDKLWEECRHKIIANCTEDDQVIFSCEQLVFFDKHEIERVKTLLGSTFEDITVIMYFRRQPEYLLSSHYIYVCIGETKNVFDFHNQHPMDYREIVKRWSLFGKDKIKIRLFDKQEFYDNDLLTDFAHAVGFEMAGLERVEKTNEAMGSAETEFLRLINFHIPRRLDPNNYNLDHDYLAKLLQSRNRKDNEASKKNFPLTQGKAKQILEQCREGNDWIAREYLRREKLFSEDVSMYPEEVDSPHGLTLEKCAEITAHLWKERCGVIGQLQQDVYTIRSEKSACDVEIQRQQTEIQHRDTEIQHQQTEIQHRDTEIQHLQTEIQHRDTYIQRQQDEINAANAEIQRLLERRSKRLLYRIKSLLTWLKSKVKKQ